MLNYGLINDRSPHIMADLCEIICYFEAIEVSRGDIERFVTTKGGEGLLSELADEGGAEANDKLQKFSEDAFLHLTYRQTAFGEWYPFEVEHDVIELKGELTEKHKIYVSLLADSRLKMFARPKRILFASEFESLCREALYGLFPAWKIYHFGSGGADRHLFGNKLKEALRKLGELIKDDVHERRVSKLPEQDTGDGGIDLIALREWGDPAESLAVYFAQCAAQQTGWPEKRFEAHSITHEKYFNFFHRPGNILFIPLCYRGPNGKWIGDDGHQTVLIDRLRLTQLYDAELATGGDIGDILAVISEPFAPGSMQQYASEDDDLAA